MRPICAGEQLQSELAGLVLLEASMPRPWERVVQLQLGPRQSDPASHALWLEIMGRSALPACTEPEAVCACSLRTPAVGNLGPPDCM